MLARQRDMTGPYIHFQRALFFIDRITRFSLHDSPCMDTTKAGHSLFNEFAPNANVFSSRNDLLNHIRASGKQSIISGYLINSYCFRTSEVTSSFWKLQLSIITQLCLIRSLSVVMAIVIPDHDGRAAKSFAKGLEAAHWKVSKQSIPYLDIGDSISDSCSVITAVHSSCAPNVDPLVLKLPPSVHTLLAPSFGCPSINQSTPLAMAS